MKLIIKEKSGKFTEEKEDQFEEKYLGGKFVNLGTKGDFYVVSVNIVDNVRTMIVESMWGASK